MWCTPSLYEISMGKYHDSEHQSHGICGVKGDPSNQRADDPHHAGEAETMTHRYALAAVLLTAFAIPAGAQVTTSQPSTGQSSTQSDTSKKRPDSLSPTDTTKKGNATTTTSNGNVSEPAAPS